MSKANAKESWLDYARVFNDIKTGECGSVRITDLEFRKIYETPQGPKWCCWVQAWFTPRGSLRISFHAIEGGSSEMKPDYKWEYANPKDLKENGLAHNYRYLESSDNGRSWNMLKTENAADVAVVKIDPKIYLDDKTLLGIGGIWCAWDEVLQTHKRVGQTVSALSRDDGKTWEQTVFLNDPSRCYSFWCHPKLLKDGTIVLPAYGKLERKHGTEWEGTTDAFLFFSTTGGRSWSEPLLLAKGLPTLTNDEPEVAELGNGELLAVLRHSDPAKAGTPDVYVNCGQVIVRKTAGRWAAGPLTRTNMGFRGFPALLRTRSGILICAGSGNQYNFSLDEGATWSATQIIADPVCNRHNHYPRLMELPDGRIMSIYHYGNHWPFPPPEDQYIACAIFNVCT